MFRKSFNFVLAVILLFVGSSASTAQDNTPTATPSAQASAILLFSQDGEIMARDIWSGEFINFTKDNEEFSYNPTWGGRGQFVIYLTWAGTDNDGFNLINIVNVSTLEKVTIARCELGDVSCTFPMMSPDGRWVAYVAFPREDGNARLYMYNMQRDTSVLVQDGWFDIGQDSRYWIDDTHFAQIGQFISNGAVIRRVFETPQMNYVPDQNIGVLPETFVGCNGETTEEVFMDGSNHVQVSFNGSWLVRYALSSLGEGNPWRDCDAGGLPKAG